MAACVSVEPTTGPIAPRRFKIYFQDDSVSKRSQEAVQQLIAAASATARATQPTSNSALLAKTALMYRRVHERMATAGVDVTPPEFDASSFLGVSWCKTRPTAISCSECTEQLCQGQDVRPKASAAPDTELSNIRLYRIR